MYRNELEVYLNQLLEIPRFRDYCPNGLQVEGKDNIQTVISGVTASLDLLQAAAAANADAIVVHHGYFWKGENQTICHMKQQRIKALLAHDINLYAYHLPLDVHPTLGNNAQLAERLGITNVKALDTKPDGVLMRGEFVEGISATELVNRVEQSLQRKPIVLGNGLTNVPDAQHSQLAVDDQGQQPAEHAERGELLHAARLARLHALAPRSARLMRLRPRVTSLDQRPRQLNH